MNSLRTFISPVFCMSLMAGPMSQQGMLAAGRPDEHAVNAEASLTPGVMGKMIEPDKLVVDFRLARQALEEGHSGIYRYTAKEELDGLFDRAEKSLIRPMNAVEFYRILAPVVAAIKCGHTGIGLPEEMQKAYSTKALLLPLQIRALAGKVYIFRDCSDDATTLAGREIRSIGKRQGAGLGLRACSEVVNQDLCSGLDSEGRLSGLIRVVWGGRTKLPALRTRDRNPLRSSCSSTARTTRKPTKSASQTHQMLPCGSCLFQVGSEPRRAALRQAAARSAHEPPRATCG